MNPFSDTLRQIGQRLSLPEPARSRVLLELAADLEDLFEHYTAQGHSEDEAAALALERAELSDVALQRLVEVHSSRADRFVDRVSERTVAGWERFLLVLVSFFSLALVGREIFRSQMFTEASGFVWPIAAAAGAGLALIAWKLYEQMFKRERDLRRLRRGLWPLMALSVLSVIVGWLGFLVEMHRAAMRVGPTAASLATESIYCVARVAPMINFCLVVAVVLAIGWFLLSSRVGRIEHAEVARMLADGGGS